MCSWIRFIYECRCIGQYMATRYCQRGPCPTGMGEVVLLIIHRFVCGPCGDLRMQAARSEAASKK